MRSRTNASATEDKNEGISMDEQVGFNNGTVKKMTEQTFRVSRNRDKEFPRLHCARQGPMAFYNGGAGVMRCLGT